MTMRKKKKKKKRRRGTDATLRERQRRLGELREEAQRNKAEIKKLIVRLNPFSDQIVETARELGIRPPAAPGDTMLAFLNWLGVSEDSRSEVFEAMVADLRYELLEAHSRGRWWVRLVRLRYLRHFACTLLAFGWAELMSRLRGISRRV
jgi:hypothetical protein